MREEARRITWHFHNSPYVDHYSGERIAVNVLQEGFYLPSLFKDKYEHYKSFDNFQMADGISKQNELSLQSMLEVEVFDYWGIYFVRPFYSYFTNKYILVAVDYVSKLV